MAETYAPEIDAETDIFGGEKGAVRRADLRLRVTEHNILVAAKYYSRLTLIRLAQLLDLDVPEVRSGSALCNLPMWGPMSWNAMSRWDCMLGKQSSLLHTSFIVLFKGAF